MTEEAKAVTENWFYEEEGQRKGGITEADLVALIKSGKVAYGTSVWKKGFPDWIKIENTELSVHLEEIGPPPLKGEHINNTVVWVLAFAPIIGYFLEYVVAGVIYEGQFDANGEPSANEAVSSGKYWYITLILNIALSYFDARRLKKAGHNIDKFKGWVWLVPVYLYQRAKNLNQNLAYFIVWIVCFVLFLIS